MTMWDCLAQSDTRVRTAACLPWAFRVSSVNGQLARCDDGGEAGVGARLATLLATAGAVDVLVAVSRQVRGPMLGGRRFNRAQQRSEPMLAPRCRTTSHPPRLEPHEHGRRGVCSFCMRQATTPCDFSRHLPDTDRLPQLRAGVARGHRS